MNQKQTRFLRALIWTMLVLLPLAACNSAWAGDLQDIKARGVLRHLGIPYANFVTGSGDGLDVELTKLFAQHLGVKYQYVDSSWDSVIGDLTGKKVKANGDDIKVLGEVPIKGDIIASGFTILNWRKKIVNFSTPTFPNQIWLVARADSPLKPIVPHESVEKDITAVRALLKGRSLLGKASTCLDPSLYNLKVTGARIKLFPGSLNDLAPAVIKGDSELTLLDVPDALVALEKFPGKIKIIGPITDKQYMGCAFAKNAPELRDAFNRFLEQAKADGTYLALVKRYYPKVFNYYRDFFETK
ncbi:MAG: transporter substrate-binding domain-containing protein [Deltaproteobacteria bacterium]|nr:transporter substrate-binding domain-containing protein [Deltaproteobacteria bacterium]